MSQTLSNCEILGGFVRSMFRGAILHRPGEDSWDLGNILWWRILDGEGLSPIHLPLEGGEVKGASIPEVGEDWGQRADPLRVFVEVDPFVVLFRPP